MVPFGTVSARSKCYSRVPCGSLTARWRGAGQGCRLALSQQGVGTTMHRLLQGAMWIFNSKVEVLVNGAICFCVNKE